ncbi:acetyl-CoA synthetase-like protein [Mycena metata]|uniref:Acetyl-CoA synthetase-like protein n=1 Tax=Mycena metata TaxID=1033252 RepID=A0AAD7MQX3_9AGAR|nr:acetyl-CoA synthetase-like protein [Mycena metata]
MSELSSFLRSVAALVLVASKTRFNQQDAILCRVFHPDGRDYFIDVSLQVTVAQYLQSIRNAGRPNASANLKPDLTIIFSPTDIAHTLAVFHNLPAATTVHFPLRGASEILDTSSFRDLPLENAWTAGRFGVALDALHHASSGTLLSDLSVLPPSEREMLLDWAVAPASTQCGVPAAFSPTIHGYFEKIAAEHPEFVAIHCSDGSRVTYGELNRWSNVLATHLTQELGVRRGDIVLQFFAKGVEMLVALLAVVKASAAYVPLDIQHPASRLRSIHRLTGAKVCLTTASLRGAISPHVDVAFLLVDEFLLRSDKSLPPSYPSLTGGEDLCYVLFTSGSTGEPKGVMVTHSSVVSSVINGPESNQQLRKLGQGLRTLMFSNYAFDYSVWDMWITLSCGGTLCISPQSEMLNDLTENLRLMSVTFLETTPTVLSLVDPTKVPSLHTVYSSGEPLTLAVREKFLPYYPRIKLFNGGAPTETTVMSVFTPIEPHTPLGIFGRPFGANRVYILDPDQQLCPVGVAGRLWIGGPQVSRGYLGRDDLTAAAYVPDPFNGGRTRMYDTGDVCVWALDAPGSERHALFYLGRADAQVKIRGQRIETGEIETMLVGIQGVKASGVVKRERLGAEELVAFIELEKTAIQANVLHEVEVAMPLQLPRYMVPSLVLPLSTLPVTLNGKLDRKQLEKLALEAKTVAPVHASESTNILPDHAIAANEKIIRDAWASALNRPATSISLDIDFYGAGGDSISCIRVAAACRSAGLSVSIMDFATATTISAQAQLTESRARIQITAPIYQPFELLVGLDYRAAIEREMASYGYENSEIDDAYPSPQSVAGMISLAAGNPLSYFAQYTYRARTKFDPDLMKAAWDLVLKRHEVLRSVFIVAPPPHNDIVQVVLNSQPSVLSWTCEVFEDELDCDAAVDDYLKRAPGFALGKCPTRVGLFQSPRFSTVVFEFHHAQYDGWSFPHLLRDLETAYGICSGGLTGWLNTPTPYSHFSRWSLNQGAERGPLAQTYWQQQLADVSLPSFPKVPVFNVRKKAVTNQSSIGVFSMGQPLADFCVAQRVTLSSCVRAAVALTLALHDSTSDVLFGVVTSGRTGEIPGVETIFGSCISTIPCRVSVAPDQTLESILQSVHAHSVDSVPFQFLGLNEILKATNFDDDIFRVLLTIENLDGLHQSEHAFLGENVRGHLLEINYPLAISVFPSPDGKEIRFQFQFDNEYLSAADIDWIQEHLFSALLALMEHPQLPVADSNFLSPKEAEFVREIGIGSVPDSSLGSFFHSMVDKSAILFPSNIALEHTGGECVTYEALVNLANQAAHGLQARGVMPEICVPVLFDKNTNQIQAVVAFLAILKAGGAFVPLDSTWPVDRLVSCIQQTDATFFICDSVAPEIAHSLSIPFLDIAQLAQQQPETPPSTPGLTMDSLCYVMVTSGSTGKPKGVLLEHKNASAYIANAATLFPLANARRFLHFSPWTFDQGLADLFLALPIGATVILADMNEMLLDLTATLQFCKADYAVLTPAVAQLIRAGTHFPHLKTLVCGGEKLPGQLIHRWGGKLELIDAYGPTEFTVHGVSESFKHSGYVPGVIGRPLGSTRAYIVDQSIRPVPVGATGELMLSGNQVARGYLHLPAETEAAFIADPFHPGQRMYRTGDLARFRADGRIEYIGRANLDGGYIKLRGLRIDVAEIEATLMSVPETLAVVEVLEQGSTQLALSPDLPALQPWMKTLVKTCKRILPVYSVPTQWVALETIPQAASNKYDRKLLRSFFQSLAVQEGKVDEITRILLSAKPARLPETQLERKLHGIWCELLGKQQLSVHDDFFNAGGDSLGAIRVLARLRNKGCHITIQEFYSASNIASLAHFIETSGNDITDDVVEEPVLGLMFPVQSYHAQAPDSPPLPLFLFHCAEGVGNEYMNLPPLERDVYAISNPSKNRMSLEANFPTLGSFTDRYIPLLPADEPIFLGGYSSGGLLAISMAARRRSLGQPVKGVILLDTFNTQGWTFRGFAPDTDYGTNHISNALNPGAKELQRLSERHTYHLIQHFVEPQLDVPVLLLRAGVRDTSDTEFYVTDGDDELNFFTRENNPLIEVYTIPGGEHADLVGYKDNFATPVVQEVAEHIRQWCRKLD